MVEVTDSADNVTEYIQHEIVIICRLAFCNCIRGYRSWILAGRGRYIKRRSKCIHESLEEIQDPHHQIVDRRYWWTII